MTDDTENHKPQSGVTLDKELTALADAVVALNARVAALEGGSAPGPDPEPEPTPPPPAAQALPGWGIMCYPIREKDGQFPPTVIRDIREAQGAGDKRVGIAYARVFWPFMEIAPGEYDFGILERCYEQLQAEFGGEVALGCNVLSQSFGGDSRDPLTAGLPEWLLNDPRSEKGTAFGRDGYHGLSAHNDAGKHVTHRFVPYVGEQYVRFCRDMADHFGDALLSNAHEETATNFDRDQAPPDCYDPDGWIAVRNETMAALAESHPNHYQVWMNVYIRGGAGTDVNIANWAKLAADDPTLFARTLQGGPDAGLHGGYKNISDTWLAQTDRCNVSFGLQNLTYNAAPSVKDVLKYGIDRGCLHLWPSQNSKWNQTAAAIKSLEPPAGIPA